MPRVHTFLSKHLNFLNASITLIVYHHIFTGPSSAITGLHHAAKLSKAQIHGLAEVTGQTIAYATAQVSFIVIFEDSQFLIYFRPDLLFAPQNSGPDSTVTSIMKHFSITL